MSTRKSSRKNTLSERAKYYGVELAGTERRRWTTEEKNLLEDYLNRDDATVWGACKILKRSYYSIRCEMLRLGMKVRIIPEMTVPEISKELGVSEHRLLRAVRAGLIPARKRRNKVSTAECYILELEDARAALPLLKAPARTWKGRVKEENPLMLSIDSERVIKIMRDSGEFIAVDLNWRLEGWHVGLISADYYHTTQPHNDVNDALKEAWLWWKYGQENLIQPTRSARS